MNVLHFLHSGLYEEVAALLVQLQIYQASYEHGIRTLAEGLEEASRGQATTISALDSYQVAEGEWRKIREQELLDQLGSKGVTFFQLSFEGAAK